MFETLKNAFKVKEIRKKIWMTLLLLLVFRLGCYIPVPGLLRDTFANAIQNNEFLELMSSITGGSLANGTLFALGIGPYINASIIIQLLCYGIPALERLSKEGEDGRRKISQITRYVAIGLAIVQSAGFIVSFAANGNAINHVIFGSGVWGETAALWVAGVYMTVIYTAGACFVMWLGDRITEYGIGNGMSMVIFAGLISTAGDLLLQKFVLMFTVDLNVIWEILGFIAITVVLFTAIITVDLSERKIPVQYAKQVKGRKMYGGQKSEIPMRISSSGVMPLIFAFSIISMPSMIMSIWFADSAAYVGYQEWFGQGTWLYTIVLCLLIFGFAFFYAMMQFNPDDVAKNIQQNGGFIQGIRPGRPTAEYLKKISGRITLFSAIYLSLVAFIPSMAFSWVSLDLVNVFSTTGILIVVSVAMEWDKQIQSQLMMKNYKGFLK
ncbi:MAG: preprotein translocase subunit SecY [Clostridia bacterium]|nr:preprotein translocase subunit SecY [Clostridia bacterium]MBO7736548.1 preprotein translocase subunit SecY [Clostridia bacterium]